MNLNFKFLALTFVVLLATIGCGVRGSGTVVPQQTTTAPVGNVVLALSGSGIIDFGTVSIGTTVTKTMSVTNNGTGPARNISLTALSAPFAFQYNGCASVLAASATCNIVVTYAPTAVTISLNLVLNYVDQSSVAGSVTAQLRGTGLDAPLGHLNISENNPYNFGLIQTGAPNFYAQIVRKRFDFKNDGNADLVINFAAFTPNQFFALDPSAFPVSLTCQNGQILRPAMVCSLVLALNPNGGNFSYGSVNPVTASSVLSYVTGGKTFTSNWTANAFLVAPPSPGSIEPMVYTPTRFKDVVLSPSSVSACITLKNAGTAPISQISLYQSLDAPFNMVSQASPACSNIACTGPGILPAGASCDYAVSFLPTAVTNYTTPFWVRYFDGYQFKTVQNTVKGNAVLPAMVPAIATVSRLSPSNAVDRSYASIRGVDGGLSFLIGNQRYGGPSSNSTTVMVNSSGCSVLGLRMTVLDNPRTHDTQNLSDIPYMIISKVGSVLNLWWNDNYDNDSRDLGFTMNINYVHNGQPVSYKIQNTSTTCN